MKTKEYNITVEKHADGLYRFILGNIRDEFKAQDIVQDSFERLWINHDSVEFDKAKSFLFKIAYNRMIDIIRHDKRINSQSEIFERVDDITDFRQAELREIINNALTKLSEIQRSVVLLRDYEGYTYEEIAQITDLSEAQVKVYIFRARQHMKNYLGKFEEVIK
ncbi:MAG: RNA polymerase sigma factor [Bacteroidales bacterium]|nr:RNA polymerase sigma factor [Bacteroidales bacterium]MDD3859952.1 RNA polymerase sigma factor [Bacteroidales bacterium]